MRLILLKQLTHNKKRYENKLEKLGLAVIIIMANAMRNPFKNS